MASISIQIVVVSEAVNRPPEVSPTFPTEIRRKVGETFDMAPYVTDPDGDTLTYTFANGTGTSPGATMSISTAGLITMLKAGNETTQVKVDDGKG